MASFSGAWNTVQPYVDPGNMLSGGPKRTDTGSVGGARPEDYSYLQDVPGTNFAYDPVSGQYYQNKVVDPQTGQVFDTGATNVVAAPNLSQQAAGNTVAQQLYTGNAQDALASLAATRAGMHGLETQYM